MTEYPKRVRMARPQDEDKIYELLLGLNLDNGFGIGINEKKVRDQIRIGTLQQGGFIGVIDGLENDPKIVASIGLFPQNWWYSDEIYLGELWLFVDPDYRFNHYDDDLFAFAKWCREQLAVNMPDEKMALVTSVSSPERLNAKIRLWRRKTGGKQIGGIFVITS